jgi:CspA family cold shock protein
VQTGIVQRFDNELGFGFITEAGFAFDIFVHYKNITGMGFKTLVAGQKVTYERFEDPGRDPKKRWRATNVAPVPGDDISVAKLQILREFQRLSSCKPCLRSLEQIIGNVQPASKEEPQPQDELQINPS